MNFSSNLLFFSADLFPSSISQSFKFMFFEILNDNILLFDFRNIYQTINIRYLDFKLNEIILNRFSDDYKGDILIKVNKKNNH